MVKLCKPKLQDLWFRRQLLADETTMSYNHAWGGTIPFPESDWADWYARWVDPGEPGRFYRYLTDGEGQFTGEIAYHTDPRRGICMADVIVYAPFRGKGYGRAGLALLCRQAREDGFDAIYDDIAIDNPARKLFLSLGFAEEYRTDGIIMLKKDLTRNG